MSVVPVQIALRKEPGAVVPGDAAEVLKLCVVALDVGASIWDQGAGKARSGFLFAKVIRCWRLLTATACPA